MPGRVMVGMCWEGDGSRVKPGMTVWGWIPGRARDDREKGRDDREKGRDGSLVMTDGGFLSVTPDLIRGLGICSVLLDDESMVLPWVDHCQIFNAGKVFGVASDQRQPGSQCNGCNLGIRRINGPPRQLALIRDWARGQTLQFRHGGG